MRNLRAERDASAGAPRVRCAGVLPARGMDREPPEAGLLPLPGVQRGVPDGSQGQRGRIRAGGGGLAMAMTSDERRKVAARLRGVTEEELQYVFFEENLEQRCWRTLL